MKIASGILLFSMTIVSAAGSPASAAPVQRFSGIVERAGPGGLLVRAGGQVMEFEVAPDQPEVRPGDHVTVIYVLKVQRLSVEDARERPGAAPEKGQDGEEEWKIDDDRIFFDASRSADQQSGGTSVAQDKGVEPNFSREAT